MGQELNINAEMIRHMAELKNLCRKKGRDSKVTFIVRTTPLPKRVESSPIQETDCMILSDDNPEVALRHMQLSLQDTPISGICVTTSCQDDKLVIEIGEEVKIANPSGTVN